MDLSIIIPVYNEEIRSLNNCLMSVSNIKKCEYEVLIIDDGSDYYIQNFCKKFIINRSNFKYIKVQNSGVSVARNIGIDTAEGDFLMFIDSDDVLIVDDLDIHNLMNVDFEIFNLKLDTPDKGIKNLKLFSYDNITTLSRGEVLQTLITSDILNGPYCKIFRTGILKRKNIRFKKNIVTGEDTLFLLDFLNNAERIIFNPRYIYKYTFELEHFSSRALKKPLETLKSLNLVHDEIFYIISKSKFDISKKRSLEVKLNERFLKKVFNTLADLSTNDSLSFELKDYVKAMLFKNEKISILKATAKFRFFLMKKQHYCIIYIIARLRIIYLKIKSKVETLR